MDVLIFIYLSFLFLFLSAIAVFNLFYLFEMNKVSRDLHIAIHGIIPDFYKLIIFINILTCILILLYLIYTAIKI